MAGSDSDSDNRPARANTSRNPQPSARPTTKKASASACRTKQAGKGAQSRPLQDLLDLSDADSEPENSRVHNTVPSNAHLSVGPAAHRKARKNPGASSHRTKAKRTPQTVRMITRIPKHEET